MMVRILSIESLRMYLNKHRKDQARYLPSLYKVVKDYLRPYVNPNSNILEVGPGGGRWTHYMMAAKHPTLVELNTEFFDYLQKRFSTSLSKLRFYQTRDYELEGVETGSIDFVFTFGIFVHIDPEGIVGYMNEFARVLKSGGHTTIQYADKQKPDGSWRPGFSDMNPSKMETFVASMPFEIVTHDTTTLPHSSIYRAKEALKHVT